MSTSCSTDGARRCRNTVPFGTIHVVRGPLSEFRRSTHNAPARPDRTLTDSPVSRRSRGSRKMRQGGRLIFWFGARGGTLANHTMLEAS
ncbi:unnamed protein product [Scytosiphon promiscuus]